MTPEEVRQIARSEILKLLSEMTAAASTPQTDSQWIGLKKAWKPLGYPSYDALYKDVEAGLFRSGKELCDRRKPGAKIARWQIDLVAARKRLAEDPSKRRRI